jgi:hypothetical protein
MARSDREPQQHALTVDELAAEATTELPDREAMTLLGTDLLPPIVGGPIPAPDLSILTDGDVDSTPIKDVLIESDIKEVSIGPDPSSSGLDPSSSDVEGP